jgi:vacuolar-type H+-ATPase catalytic subunit A/Vma1
MLCIVDPLFAVCGFFSERLDGNLEAKVEAMSSVVMQLLKENERLGTIADTVPRLIKDNKELAIRVNKLEEMVQEQNDKGADTTDEMVKNKKLVTMVDTIMKENEQLKNKVNLLEQTVQDGVPCSEEMPFTTEGISEDNGGNHKSEAMSRITETFGMQGGEKGSKRSNYITLSRKRRIGNKLHNLNLR